MRKLSPRFVPTLGIAFTLSVIVCAGQTQSPAPGKTAEQVYRNIQVLKDSPADQLIPAMQFICASLGVRCDHCHVENAFDKDDKKPKQTARQMIRMVMALNQNIFQSKREVTCYSCHRGSLRPATIPAVATERTMPKQTNPPTEPSRSADTVLAAFLQASGCGATLQKIRTEVEKGTIDLGRGVQFPVEIYIKSPAARTVVTHLPTGESLDVVNGNSGWSLVPGMALQTLNPSELVAAHIDADLQFAANLKTMFASIETQPDDTIDGRLVNVLRASSPALPPVELYFAADSGMLGRMVRYLETPLGRYPTQIDYSDYRDVVGTKVAFRRIISQPQGRYVIQIEQLQHNVPVDDSKFAKPEPPGGDSVPR